MTDVIKKNTKTLSLKNPSGTNLTKIIKDSLDIDINNLKGSDIPKIFKKGLKFKGVIGKKIIDGVADYFKKNPNTIKRYEKSLPNTLKKRIDKLPVTTTPKKIKKIDIANIMKNPRTGRGQNLPTRITNKNKNTGTNITKRVIEGEVLQGIKKPKNDSKVNQQTIEGQFKRLTPQAIRNQMKNTRTGRGQDKLNISGLKRKTFLAVDKDFPKMPPQQAPSKELDKKVKPPKDFSPKIKKTPTPSVKREELPKTKSNDYTGRFIDKEGNVAYDSFSDFIAHMTGKPKKRAMPKKTARIIGTGDKLKRKEADTKGAGKGVKFKAFSGGGLIAGLYDKPEKAETYKGNTSSARQVKGYGKARKRP